MVKINDKWIEAELIEQYEDSNSGEYILVTKVIPYGLVSRNGIEYIREYAERTKEQIKGLYLFHNHVTDGSDVFPRGEWFEAWSQQDGLYTKARVYNTKYNKDYIEWLKSAKTIKVSLRADGDVEYAEDSNGEQYKRAAISSWKEISTVNIPGFMDAEASFVTMAEKLLEKECSKDKNKYDEEYEDEESDEYDESGHKKKKESNYEEQDNNVNYMLEELNRIVQKL